jgi:hypothetical protein
MLYGHTRPVSVWSVAGANSPAFETDVRLGNSQPSEQTVISGIASSSPAIEEYFDLMANWAVPQAIGVVGILNLSCAPGVRIVVTGRRLGDAGYTRDLGGNSDTATAQLGDGRVQAIILPTATEDDYIGLQVRIYNDAGGVTWADDTTDLYVGEIAPFATLDIPKVDARRETARTIRRVKERAVNGAVHLAWRGEYRSFSLVVRGTMAEAHLGALDGLDWDALRVMQDTPLYRALVIPRIHGGDGQIDYALCNKTALFGVVEWGSTTNSLGQSVECPLSVEEAP